MAPARIVVGLALAVSMATVVDLPASDATVTGGGPAAERLVVVGQSDTLWDLASVHAPDDVTRRDWIAEVTERNGVDPRELRPGDVLRVPSDS